MDSMTVDSTRPPVLIFNSDPFPVPTRVLLLRQAIGY